MPIPVDRRTRRGVIDVFVLTGLARSYGEIFLIRVGVGIGEAAGGPPAQSLLSDQATAYVAELNADYDRVRLQHANKKVVPLWPLAKARRHASKVWPQPA